MNSRMREGDREGELLAQTPDIFGRAFQIATQERLLRDPLHGLISIDEGTGAGRLLVGLIDSREFQRLRRIRQLGFAHYAFQGAEHSRFTHSIGAFHLMCVTLEQLARGYTIDSELALIAKVSALLHDVGHGPFSHVSERFLGRRHEVRTVEILHDERTEIHQTLSAYDTRMPSYVESMLNGTASPGYLCSLVNSQLDVDRLDYLLRDSLMTGVKYGVYDVDRLIHMLRIAPDGDKVIVAESGLAPIEKYIQARYHMYRQVYLHKTVTAAEAMLMALFERAGELLREGADAALDADDPLAKALSDPANLDLLDYLELDDAWVFAQLKRWAKRDDPVLSDLADRLLRRKLFKTIDIDPSEAATEGRLSEAAAIVKSAGLDPKYYLLRVDSSDTPYRPYDLSAPRAADHIYIEDGRDRIVDVAQVSPTIAGFTTSEYTLSRLVFPSSHDGCDLREKIEQLFAAQA